MEEDQELNIIEDNDSEERFEIALHGTEQQSRPVSGSSNRPASATRVRLGDPAALYRKIQTFTKTNGISRQMLIANLRDYPKMSDFKSGFDDLGLHLTMDEVAIIFKDQGIPKSGIIQTHNIVDLLVQDQELTSLKNETQAVAETAKVTHKSKSPKSGKRNLRPQTGSVRSSGTSQTGRPTSATTGITGFTGADKKSNPKRLTMDEIQQELDMIDQREAMMMERNTELRKQTKKKTVKETKNLALTIDKCKREFEYESLHKMGEANEIAQSQNLPISFRALKKENGEIVCHIFEHENFVKEIDLDQFQREWRRMKKTQKGSINLFSEDQRPVSAANAKVNKRDRQDELKRLLLDTKELTNKLKEQLKIF